MAKRKNHQPSTVSKGVVIPLDVADLIVRVFLPSNERRMRTAAPEVVAAVTAFKRAVSAHHLADGDSKEQGQ
jgi:hypothetical protein